MSGAGEATSAPTRPPRLRVLLTVFNRKAHTLACLERLVAQAGQVDVEVGVVLVDDGSRDGTADAVRARFPAVQVVAGSGHLYWNGGMRLALQLTRREDPDFYLLLNDDTNLLPGALARLLSTHRALGSRDEVACIVVGSTRDPVTGAHSYGGWRRGPWHHPARFVRVPPGAEALPCDTLNGNCVLIPRDALERVGGLDPAFTHGIGDTDLGLRARRAGCSLWVAPGYQGECVENVGRGLWQDASLDGVERWRRLLGPKGLPPREWLTFTSRHGGPFWPLLFAWPYVKIGWLALRRRPGTTVQGKEDHG